MTLDEIVVENLTRLRTGVGWSQDQMAREMRGIGIPWARTTVADVERGKSRLSLAEVCALAAVFDCDVSELLHAPGAVELTETGPRARMDIQGTVSITRKTAADPTGPDPATQKAAAALGVDVEWIEAQARELWGRGLTEERERRVAKHPSPSRATRGHTTRALLAELRAVLDG